MAPKAAAAKGKSGPSEHASYQDMITDAIITLKDRNGSSRSALKKYVRANNKISAVDAMFDSLFNRALRTGVDKGVFAQPKGASGGTKLAKKEPKPAAAKTEKKATTAKPKKAATATKKTAAAKVTKPKTATKAKAAATKTAAKSKAAAKPAAKAKAKKAAAPKAAPAIVDKPAVLGKTKSGRVTKTTAKTPAKKATPKKAAPKKSTPKKSTPKKAAA